MRSLVCLILAVWPCSLLAATLAGTVKDPSDAVVRQARVEITGGALTQPLTLISDQVGHFVTPDLQPGTYRVRVTSDNFEPLEKSVEIGATPAILTFQLSLPANKQEVTVYGKVSAFANSDPVYQQLRRAALGKSFAVRKFSLKFDVATFTFTDGTFTFLAPIERMSTGAIFVGHGHFNLTPDDQINSRELSRRVKTEVFDEDFNEAVFRFVGPLSHELLAGVGAETNAPEANAVLERWRDNVRRRNDVPMGFTDYLLKGEAMDNVDADILASVYNPHRPGFFSAYIHGVKHKDLRFYVRPHCGAIPQLDSPEEVAVVNVDPGGMEDGIWYLNHLLSEYAEHVASAHQERRCEIAKKFRIETVIGNNDRLTSVAAIAFEPVIEGERVIKFHLLPNLRVTRVSNADGKDLYFVQESRKADGSFYVILPAPAEMGKQSSLTIEYLGDKVVRTAGVGSFYVGAREAWYPNINGFSDRALYDLTFHVPKKYSVISVGTVEKEWTENNFAVSHWTTATPVAIAGFNYGTYEKVELPDTITGYHLEGYYLSDLPDVLRPYANGALSGMAPGGMAKYALDQARAQLQLCTHFFGRSPFDHIYITEQPNFTFGQSWPNLVYLPISAYIDSTQRWMLFGHIDNNFTAFVQEVTPHEVAHQWWGHAVGWASYHDQWLSEGFAEFSAGLFLQQAVGKGWQKDYIEFWDRQRRRILEKNAFGVAPNDAGPLWLGIRLAAPQTENAYQNVTYPKGAYVLSMLRSIMYTNQDQDKAFIDMMHDFVASHKDLPASTESFEAVVEKYMTRTMDLNHNGRMDWFFNEWVYGTKVPRYQFEYKVTKAEGGRAKLHMTITQSEVENNFAMLVPIFGDFGNGMIRMGQLPVVGNTSSNFDIDIPKEPKKVALNAYREILER